MSEDRIIDNSPTDPEALVKLGIRLEEQNKFDKAEQAYRKALEIQPDYVLAWFNLGLLLIYQNKFNKAEEAIVKLLKFNLVMSQLGIILDYS